MVLLLRTGRCCEAENCAILLPLKCAFRWYPFLVEVQILRYWPKTMDYNQAFSPKLRSFFVVLLLYTGGCCEAEICAILLLLCTGRCYRSELCVILLPMRYHVLQKSVSGRKPWTIVRRSNHLFVPP